MNSVRKGLLNQAATFRTNLRRPPGINFRYPTTSIASFVVEHSDELSPGSVGHALRDVAAAKAVDVQIFDGDEAKLVDQSVRELVLEVTPLVGNVLMLFGEQKSQLLIALTTRFCARSLALSDGKLFLRGAEPTGIIDLLTRGQRSEKLKAHINADFGFAVVPNGNIGQFDLEDDVPVVQSVPLDDGLLDNAVIGDRAMLEDADMPDILDIELVILQPEPIAVAEFERGKPTNSLETRIARFLSCFDAAEEAFVRFIQTAKNLLTGRVIQLAQAVGVFLANIPQLVGLVIIVDRDLLELPVVPSLLKGSIVKQASLLKEKVEVIGLLFSWVKSELVTAFHRLLFWASIYLRIVSADTLPAVPT